jgi:CBS domain-containing protein
MMKARDIMTADPACCTPEQTAREAAQLMRERDCGCAPVVDVHVPTSQRR